MVVAVIVPFAAHLKICFLCCKNISEGDEAGFNSLVNDAAAEMDKSRMPPPGVAPSTPQGATPVPRSPSFLAAAMAGASGRKRTAAQMAMAGSPMRWIGSPDAKKARTALEEKACHEERLRTLPRTANICRVCRRFRLFFVSLP